MGCGASKAVSATGETSTDDLETIASSITHIRDIAPAEVADTGAPPPRRLDDPIRRNLYYQAATTLSLPGVVPEPPSESERLSSSSRRGESLIKMHPPKRPQRLEDPDLPTVMSLEPEVSIQG